MCGKTCLKFSSLFFLTVFFVISLVEILGGSYMLMDMYKINRPETLGNQHLAIPSLSLILFGIALLPLIILGCCGFCKEVSCCVNLYSSVLLVMSVLQILVGIFAILTFTKTNLDLKDEIKESFTYSFKHYQNEPIFVNTIQNEMYCCGMNLPTDWANPQLPSSCCGDKEADCHLNSPYLYGIGCVPVLIDYILFWNSIIGYVSVAIGTLEVLLVILGFSLGCGSFKNYYKV